jgi:hypothetical protein
MARKRWRRWLGSVLPELGGVVIYSALLGAFWLINVLIKHLFHIGGGPWSGMGMLVGRFGGWGLLAILLMLAVVAGGLLFAATRLLAWGVRRLTPGDC